MSKHWKAELELILQSIPDRDEPGRVIDDLCRLGAAMGEVDAEALLDAHPDLFAYWPTLKQAAYERTVRNEILQTRQFLQQDLNGATSFKELANPLSLANYNRSIGMFDHVDFSNCRRMVLVGCGWMPATLFHVHERTDVTELVGLDIIPEAIATANTLARRLGYGRVKAELNNGCAYDYSQAQIVYIVSMASPKSAIVSRIADTAPDNIQVIVREPYSLARLWDETIERPLDPRYEVTGRGQGSGAYLTRDVYLRRRRDPISGTGRNAQ